VAPGTTIDLAGRVALVTGGGSGIGRAIALELAAHGADVVVVGRSIDTPNAGESVDDTTARQITVLGRRCLAVRADIAVDADLERIVSATIAEFGRLDFLVNNAAQFESTPVLDSDLDTLDRMWRVNVRAPYRLTKLALPAIVAAGGGAVVNISSGAAWHPEPPGPDSPPAIHRGPEYGITKAALDRFTTGIARELVPHRVGAVGIWVRYTMTESNAGRAFPGLDPSEALPMSATSRAVLAICADPLAFTGQLREPGGFTHGTEATEFR
jgi:citronellol/citronellal dehydrogenase